MGLVRSWATPQRKKSEVTVTKGKGSSLATTDVAGLSSRVSASDPLATSRPTSGGGGEAGLVEGLERSPRWVGRELVDRLS